MKRAETRSISAAHAISMPRGKTLAEKVQGIVGDTPTRGDYRKTATTAGVQLLQRNYAAAGKLYAAVVAMAPGEIASHESSWLQAFRLMAALKTSDQDRALVRDAFKHLKEDPTP